MDEALRTEVVEALAVSASKHDERAIELMNTQGARKEDVDREQSNASYLRDLIERVKEDRE